MTPLQHSTLTMGEEQAELGLEGIEFRPAQGGCMVTHTVELVTATTAAAATTAATTTAAATTAAATTATATTAATTTRETTTQDN